ncbi:MAG: hypothetical protein KatS3mg027_1711 [Bacteroidia bacterium]|nr:MAG: hypothetical protein KatS3mg027_1711 [Bacteroidia bacterium]
MKIGLVLSGGGVRGVAHLGVIKCLKEWNVPIHCISGTSAGALVGAFIASNYKPEDILKITKHIELFDWKTLSIGTLGFLKMHKIEIMLEKYLPETFEKLKIPLFVCATDIINNQYTIFNTGQLIPTLLASSSIPILYEPVLLNNIYYVDGGVLNNLPVEPIENQCDKIIAIHVNHMLPSTTNKISFKDLLEKTFHLSISQSVYLKKDKCDIFIDIPNMSQFSMFDIKNADAIYDYAYQYTNQNKEHILQQINR